MNEPTEREWLEGLDPRTEQERRDEMTAKQIEMQFSDAEWDLIGEIVVSSRMDGKRIDQALVDAGLLVERIINHRERSLLISDGDA